MYDGTIYLAGVILNFSLCVCLYSVREAVHDGIICLAGLCSRFSLICIH